MSKDEVAQAIMQRVVVRLGRLDWKRPQPTAQDDSIRELDELALSLMGHTFVALHVE